MTQFSSQDMAIFDIPDFAGRMSALKESIRPKLESLGEQLVPLLETQFKQDFYPHVAKHMRRRVNPPDETWVALGPQKRGYKAYVYFAFCVGKSGAHARVVMKDESPMRKAMGQNLAHNIHFFERHRSDFKNLHNYILPSAAAKKNTGDLTALKMRDLEPSLLEIAERLQKLKSALFDVGIPLKCSSKRLVQDCLKAFDLLFPFYECGLKEKVELI